jgi:hypothetical protein
VSKREEIEALFSDLAKKRDKAQDQLRTLSGKADFLASTLMPVQALVEQDTHRKIAIRCPRRAGKSWTVMLLVLIRCLRKKNQNWLILGLARPSIENIYWRALLRLNEELDLKGHPQHTKLVLTLPNGSTISFAGAATREEIEKLRGPSYDGVVVDECKSFNPVVFQELVYDVLEPATDDRAGQLFLIGTPGEILAGPFYESTCRPPVMRASGRPSNRHAYKNGVPVDPTGPGEWSLHTWTRQENIRVVDKKGRPVLWRRALKKKADMGWKDDHPTWMREYLGEWVAGLEILVYRYQPDLHDYDPWPEGTDHPWGLPHKGPWNVVMGIDLGYRDPTAIVIWAYSENDPNLWEVYSEKRGKQNAQALTEWIREIESIYGEPDVRVIDGANTQFIETIADEPFNIGTEAAEKRTKNDAIIIFNTYFDLKQVKIRRGSPLSEELLLNKWLESSLGTANKKEDDRTPNDLCDAGLYAQRYTHHHRFKPAPQKVEDLSMEWWSQYRKQQLNDMRQKAKEAARSVFDIRHLDRDLN